MKEAITQVKGWIDDIVHLLMSFVAVGAMSEAVSYTHLTLPTSDLV